MNPRKCFETFVTWVTTKCGEPQSLLYQEESEQTLQHIAENSEPAPPIESVDNTVEADLLNDYDVSALDTI